MSKEKAMGKSWIKSYSFVFLFLSLLLYSLNIFYKKSFVYSGTSLAGDGLVQHYTALAYYGEYLRTIWRNLSSVSGFSIPEFDICIGLGGSIVTTLGYEVLGDPLNLLSAFVPMQYTEYLYVFLIVFRLYLAGIVFCQYCFYHSFSVRQTRRKNGMEIILLAVMSANIFLSMYSYYSPLGGGCLKDCGDWGHAWQDVSDGPLCALEGMEEEKIEGVRVDTVNMSLADVRVNSAMLRGVNSIPYYFSMINGSSAAFLHEMQLPTPLEHQYVSLDGRAILSSLLGVRYQIVRLGEEAELSYGYNSLVQERDGYAVYETDNALPLAFLYDHIMRETDYNMLDVAEKQQVMMQVAVIEDGDLTRRGEMSVMNSGEAEYCHWDSMYQIEDAQGVSIQDNRYEVAQEGAFIQLRTDCSQAGERYFLFDNLWYEGADSARITVTDNVNVRGFDVNSVTSNYYAGIHDFLCNMGYSKEHGDSYRIIFSRPGIYSIDEIRIVDQQLGQLETWSSARKENEVAYSFGEDKLFMQVETKGDSLLYLSLPYSEGWSAWIDGKKVPVMKVNHFGMGMYISQGEHSICLQYHTPFLRTGLVLMAAGAIGGGILLGWGSRGRQKKGAV